MREKISELGTRISWRREKVWRPYLVVLALIQIILSQCCLCHSSSFISYCLQKRLRFRKGMLLLRENCRTISHSRALLSFLKWSLTYFCCICWSAFGDTRFTITLHTQNINSKYDPKNGSTKKVLLEASSILGAPLITWVFHSSSTM
jgi:hypothetical protein